MPILKNPKATLKKPALGFWANGYTLKTEKYRLSKYKVDTTIHSVLFDHTMDKNEVKNVADAPKYKRVLKELDKQFLEVMPATYWKSL